MHDPVRQTSNAWNFAAMILLATLIGLLHRPAAEAALLEATWTGLGVTDAYDEADNWEIDGAPGVPLNGADTYNVTIGANQGTVVYDLDAASSVTDLTLGANTTLEIRQAASLTVDDDSIISGILVATGNSNATFLSPGLGASFGNSGRAMANGASTIAVAAMSYAYTAGAGSPTLFSADGSGSLLDLSSLQTFSQ